MKKNPESSYVRFFAVVATVLAVLLGAVSVAEASLTFTATTINNDGATVIDGSSTISIGTSGATGLTLGHTGATTTVGGGLVVSGTCTGCFNPAGDLGGSASTQTVIGLQGRPVSSTAPSTNQLLEYNGSFWIPATISVGSSSITLNGVATGSYALNGTANQITIGTTATPGVFVWSLPTNLSLTNATASGNVTVQGNLFDASGNKYVTSTSAGGGSVSTSTAITVGTIPFWTSAAGGLAGTSTLIISTTTLIQSGSLQIAGTLNVTSSAVFNNALTQSGGVVSLASTTINGSATTTGNLRVLGTLLDASGNQYSTSTGAGYSGCSSNGQSGITCGGSYTAGNTGSSTGELQLSGKTSGSTVTVTVGDSTGSGTLTLPGATGNIPYESGTMTSGHCVEVATDGVGISDAGAPCGSGGGGSSGVTQIASMTTSGNANSVTFSSIPSSYTNLMVVITARSGSSVTTAALFVAVNADNNGSDYIAGENMSELGNSTFPGNSGGGSGNGQFIMNVPGTSAPSLYPGNESLVFSGYTNNNFYKMFQGQFVIEQETGSNGTDLTQVGGGWGSTSTINQLTFTLGSSDTFVNGSAFTLYGMN